MYNYHHASHRGLTGWAVWQYLEGFTQPDGLFLVSASQVASSPAGQVEEEEPASASSAGHDAEEGTVCFVLEERSGYMEPSLRFLAVAHTVVSFFCIFGYYCLKVAAPEGLFMKLILEEQKNTEHRSVSAALDRSRW